MTVLDMTLNHLMAMLRNAEYTFIAIAPWSTLAKRVVTPDRVLSRGQTELFDIETECNQMTHGKLNCLKLGVNK